MFKKSNNISDKIMKKIATGMAFAELELLYLEIDERKLKIKEREFDLQIQKDQQIDKPKEN